MKTSATTHVQLKFFHCIYSLYIVLCYIRYFYISIYCTLVCVTPISLFPPLLLITPPPKYEKFLTLFLKCFTFIYLLFTICVCVGLYVKGQLSEVGALSSPIGTSCRNLGQAGSKGLCSLSHLASPILRSKT